MRRVALIVAIFALVTFAQQTQPQPKNEPRPCGKHVVKVEKQNKCGDCCAGEDCAQMESKCQKLQSSEVKPTKCDSSHKANQPKADENQSVKPAEKPTGK